MSDINFGLKLWSTNDNLIKEAKELIDKGFFHYVELMVIPDTEISSFLKIKAPFIIHIASERSGFNIGDRGKEEFNLKIINQSIKWADKLNARYLILHPGFGSIANTKEFLEKINDRRILIENMPKKGLNDEKMIGFTPGQIKELMGNKFGFCLDFGHTIKTAISLKKDYKEYVKEFLELNPKVLHISDGMLSNEEDEHLDIGKGDFDFNFLVDCIKKSQAEYIILETPKKDLNSLGEDLENLKKLKLFF